MYGIDLFTLDLPELMDAVQRKLHALEEQNRKLTQENAVLNAICTSVGIRSRDRGVLKQMRDALFDQISAHPGKPAPASELPEMEQRLRFQLPAGYEVPPHCSIRSFHLYQYWDDEEGYVPLPCDDSSWDGCCTSCTCCDGGRDWENAYDVIEDLAVRVKHLTAEIYRMRVDRESFNNSPDVRNPYSPLYEDLDRISELSFPAYREMLRCRFHGQDFMESDDWQQSILSIVENHDNDEYGPRQYLQWRFRRFGRKRYSLEPCEIDASDTDPLPPYTDEELNRFIALILPESGISNRKGGKA